MFHCMLCDVMVAPNKNQKVDLKFLFNFRLNTGILPQIFLE